MTWRERVVRAQTLGEFSREDKTLAGAFTTCAVGEQRRAHPEVIVYTRGNTPRDGILDDLGMDFFWAVQADDVPKAGKLLDDIDDRVLDLKRGGSLPTTKRGG